MAGAVAAFDRCLARIARDLATEFTNEVRRQTPVDTGLARDSWTPAIGEPTVIRYSTPAEARAAQIAGIASLRAFVLPVNVLTVTNPQPYIRGLNEGRSKKAPSMFIQRARRRAIRRVASRG